MQNKRRNFLKTTSAGALACLLPGGFIEAYNGGASGKKLILLSLSGGCDTTNIFIPYNEPNYYNLRPTIAIDKNTVLPLNTQLGLNPKFTNLKRIWDNNHVALFPATHSGLSSNTSHFYQDDFFDSGSYTDNASNNGSKGWLARYFDIKYGQTTELYAYNFATKRKMFQHMMTPAFEYETPQNLSLVSKETKANLLEMMPTKDPSRNTQALKISNSQKKVFNLLDRLSNLNMSYDNKKSKLYNDAENAKKILNGISELEIVQLIQRGYDTHKNQNQTLEKGGGKFDDLDETLGSLYDGLVSNNELDNTLIIVHTEFGRTANENGSEGTDHGQASAWFVIGGQVTGGQRGVWPGFSQNTLIEKNGRHYLKQETDYRDILSQALTWLGAKEVSDIFPGYTQNLKNNEIYL